MTAQEPSSPLAAMISAIAGGKPVTALDVARARVEAVDTASKPSTPR